MKLLNFIKDGQVHLGMQLSEGVLDVTGIASDMPTCTDDVIQGGQVIMDKLKAISAEGHPLLAEAQLDYAPAVYHPQHILCIGLNYKKHVKEFGKGDPALPEHPIWFSKFSSSLVGHRHKVIRCKASKQHDAEAEIVVVIGKRGRYIPKEKAAEYIFGYTLGNDISARDLQSRSKQWMIGKANDTFAPLGPVIVTKDQIDESTLNICGTINGAVTQNSTIDKMIFDIPTQIADASQFFELQPGDVIYTGTCEGVIMGRTSLTDADWLKPGDVVTVESDHIGILSNEIADD